MKDKRVVRTERIIQNVFINLVKAKGYSNVTVREIAQKAHINRNTFYLHYQDKEDLIDKMVFEAFEDIFNNLITMRIYDFPVDEYQESITKLLDLISLRIELYRILLNDPNLTGYFSLFERKVYDYVIERYPAKSSYDIARIEFKLSGFFGIIKQWILHDRYSKEDMISLFNNELY